MNTIGEKLKLTVFGESHQSHIGCTIDGLPSGIKIDLDKIDKYLQRRRPGLDKTSTPRKEDDKFEIITGLFEGKTDGSPLTAICKNNNTKSSDYAKGLIRPSHSDLGAYIKFEGDNDYRGGGMFSGRLTAPIVFAGAISDIYLKVNFNIDIESSILCIGGETDSEKFDEIILKAKNDGDSVGGMINVTAQNIPAGLGDPMFNSIESKLSQYLYSVPAVKGVLFGAGLNFIESKGSEINDEISIDNDEITFLTNHNGGVCGGITTGAPIDFDVIIKPTPTISKPQNTINIETKENIVHSFQGRHDPCIVKRAQIVLETITSLCIFDILLSQNSL